MTCRIPIVIEKVYKCTKICTVNVIKYKLKTKYKLKNCGEAFIVKRMDPVLIDAMTVDDNFRILKTGFDDTDSAAGYLRRGCVSLSPKSQD